MIMTSTIKIKDNRSTYPGGKGGSGVYQQIINLIPPHDVYIETHLGAGSILRHKRPAPLNIGIDLDPKVIECWTRADITKTSDAPRGSNTTKKAVPARAKLKSAGHVKNNGAGSGTVSPEIPSGDGEQSFSFINDDASSFLKKYKFTGNEFVYVDPPYLMETRKGGKLYDFEYTTRDHLTLLDILKYLPCMVMVSGYWSSLYSEMLQGWNSHSFEAQTRHGMATEWLWFNYPAPEKLHDYSYLGNTFRDRERIKKKRDRWVARLLRTPAMERNAIFHALVGCLPDPASPEKKMGPGSIVKKGVFGSQIKST